MAVLEINALSVYLSGSFSATVFAPESPALGDGRKQAVILLHDLGGCGDDFRGVKNLESLANQLGVFFVAPTIDHSFGFDLRYGGKFGKFLWEEVPGIFSRMFPIQEQGNRIAGVGTGAYAAWMLSQAHPEQFQGCVLLDGRFDVAALCEQAAAGNPASGTTAPMLEAAFGPLEQVRGGEKDPFRPGVIPMGKVFLGCREDCPWQEENQRLSQALEIPLHHAATVEALLSQALC